MLPKLGAGVDGFPKAGAGAGNPADDDVGLPNVGAGLPKVGCELGAAPKRGDATGAAVAEANGLGAMGGFWIENGVDPDPVEENGCAERLMAALGAGAEDDAAVAVSNGLGTPYFFPSFLNISASRPCDDAKTNKSRYG
jgi:hypothetical protein